MPTRVGLLSGLAALLVALGGSPARAQPIIVTNFVAGNAQLVWPASSNYDAQVETSITLVNWQPVWPPYPAPLSNALQTNSFTVTNASQFYRVRYNLLTNSPIPTTPGVYTLSFVSGRLARTYRIHIPTNYSAVVPAPLAFILHGHGQTAASFAGQHPELAAQAQAATMVLVFPQSTVSERGTGWVNYDPEPGEPYVNDAQFILELLNHVAGTLNIDRRRVYAAGFSNGGQMVHYLAARSTNVFAAYAIVASAIGGGKGATNLVYVPPPSEPTSVLIVNATNDCARPFWGGPNDAGTYQTAAIEAPYHYTSHFSCLDAPVVTRETNVFNASLRPNYGSDCPNTNPPAGQWTNYVTRTTWLGCSNWNEVIFVELSDGGHLWPDAGDRVGFDANAEVMEFFLRHCRCQAAGAIPVLAVPTTPGQHERSFCDQGYWRRFRLSIPAGYTGAAATDLVFALHGGDQTMPEFAASAPGLFTKCNLTGVLLCLPEATQHPETRGMLWNHKPVDVVVDDRSFLTNLLGQLDGALNIDRRRVYLCGFDSGGTMGFWMSATWTNVLAAIGTVGSMTGWNDQTNGTLIAPPAPLEPVPVHMTRGTLDAQVPLNGGTNNAGQLTYAAGDDLAYWVGGNTCLAAPATTVVGTLTSTVYAPCSGISEVQLDVVDSLTHRWPESPGYNASIRIVDFLRRFTRP